MANELTLVSSRPDPGDDGSQNADDLGVELEAMSTIGRTLEAIDDVALRQRILQWAVERWGVDRSRSDAVTSVTVEPQPRQATGSHANDPALSVDSIDDLFGDSPDNPIEARPVVVPKAQTQTQTPAPSGKAPVESMLQSLAADFQRLADEWNGA
jgi:hypothetical protein